ncbi:MAG TPA: DUF2073 domain-containing protein [Thermoplasmatales archaeon]|nr:DUF2073 domain-containing protein [Thermoplasmata archaeon]HEB37181.1 DUF2073 domain-containing protein [Thermoplasmatales archaeon]
MKSGKTGITVNLVSRSKFEELTSGEKVEYILNEVKKGKILVLESGLTPTEQSALIQQTMKKIDHDTFIGIEMEGYPEEKLGFLQRLLGIPRKPRLTVIGPAHLLKTIKKDDAVIETVIVPGKGVT